MARFNLQVVEDDGLHETVLKELPGANSITYARRKAVAILKEERAREEMKTWVQIYRSGVLVGEVTMYNTQAYYMSYTESGHLLYRLYPFGNIDKKPIKRW